jgi:hypothetical protein
LFAATLVGVAVFTIRRCGGGGGLGIVTLFKVLASPFAEGAGVGLVAHLGHEWVLLANLFGLLLDSRCCPSTSGEQRSAWLPRLLPDDWAASRCW